MLQKTREWLALILIGFLPLHALLVTVGTKFLEGPGSAPLPVLALWKEALILIILIFAALEWIKTEKQDRALLKVDKFDVCILLLVILSLIVTATTHGNWKLYLFGFKYDFVPLITFVILRRVQWSEGFSRAAINVILTLGGLVAAYGLATLVLSMSFFRALGYSDLHSLYLPDAPLAAFQQIGGGGVRRIQSTLSGPNQLGLWLILPWSFGIVLLFSSWFRAEHPLLHVGAQQSKKQYLIYVLYVALIGAALLFTFSRTAWIAAVAVAITFIVMNHPKHGAIKQLIRLFGAGVMLLIITTIVEPNAVMRLASSKDHLLKPIAAARSIISHPFGEGLGAAGPASNRVSDTCVQLEEGADASWASDRPDLCVFVGEEQVQPIECECTCPRVTENWYLQMGVEMGVLGFILYLVLTLVVLMKLAASSAVFLPFLGISIAGLLLHSWEVSAVAYTLWLLAATQLTKKTD